MSCYLPLVSQASQIAMTASNLFHHPSKPLFGYVTVCSAVLIALLVTGAVQVVPCWNMDILGYHNISYLINESIYLVKVEGSAFCLVFCSTLAALVSVIPLLCSLILRS